MEFMQTNNKTIVCINFLNNYSGSPNVLSVVVKGLISRGYTVEIITNKTVGFLSDIDGVKYSFVTYNFSRNLISTSLYFFVCQVQLFFKVLARKKDKHIFYINTIIPFAALFALWLTKRKYIVHVHENMNQNKVFFNIYRFFFRLCNTKSIFVSNYLKDTAVNCREAEVIYNALPQTYLDVAADFLRTQKKENLTILMVASLKRFKGIYEFAELSKLLPQYQFELVLSATESEVSQFAEEIEKPKNLRIYSIQKNLHPFYQRSKLLLQLSHPETWVETFGLTILEAMVYGVPAIVPDVGGPTELVENNYNGFTVNPHQLSVIKERIETLMTDDKLYQQLQERSLIKSQEFKEEIMINLIEKFIQ